MFADWLPVLGWRHRHQKVSHKHDHYYDIGGLTQYLLLTAPKPAKHNTESLN